MSLQKIIKSLLPVVAGPAVIISGCTGLNFYKYHNVKYIKADGTLNCSKVDGIFASTDFSIYKDGRVYIYNGSRTYWDENGDGKVDEVTHWRSVFLERGPPWESFYRAQHLEQYPLVFQEADKDFKEQQERFKDFCK